MSLVLDPRVDVQSAQTIKLGSEDFLIAPLMLRQTMVISPLLPTIIRILNHRTKIADDFRASREGKSDEDSLSTDDAMVLAEKLVFTQPEFDACIKVIRSGLSRAYPAVTDDDILDRGISVNQIITAISIVISQTRLVENSAGATPKGEA